MNAILLASAGVVILLVGGGVGFWVGRSGIGGSKARIEKAEAELEEYKRSVTEHFGQTAAHFQAIGKQYRELYEHMANGEQALCDSAAAGRELLFGPGADATSTDVDEPSVEAAAEEAEDVKKAVEEPAHEETVEIADKTESEETVMSDESVSEAAAESQPEAKAETEERTLH